MVTVKQWMHLKQHSLTVEKRPLDQHLIEFIDTFYPTPKEITEVFPKFSDKMTKYEMTSPLSFDPNAKDTDDDVYGVTWLRFETLRHFRNYVIGKGYVVTYSESIKPPKLPCVRNNSFLGLIPASLGDTILISNWDYNDIIDGVRILDNGSPGMCLEFNTIQSTDYEPVENVKHFEICHYFSFVRNDSEVYFQDKENDPLIKYFRHLQEVRKAVRLIGKLSYYISINEVEYEQHFTEEEMKELVVLFERETQNN